jgi:hypothetical protein
LILTDARIGLAGVGRIITSISRTFLGGFQEDWVVAFGGTPPSFARLVRKLTVQPRS